MFHAFLILAGLITQANPHEGGEDARLNEEYQYLAKRYEEAYNAFLKANLEAKSRADEDAVNAHPGRDPRGFASEFMRLAKDHPGSKAAEDSLIWVASHVRYGPETEEAKRLLTRDHIASDRLDQVFGSQWRTAGSPATEHLLRRAFARSPHREVRGLAGYWLARFLKEQANWSREARRNPDRTSPRIPVIEDGRGADYLARLRQLDPDALDGEAEQLLYHVAKVYGDVPIKEKIGLHETLGPEARSFLHEYRQLAIGRPAAEIEGEDLDGVRFKLSDHRGKVVVLDFGSHSYCGLCREMYPHARSLVKRLEGKPFVLLGINADPDREALKAAMKEAGNTWRCWWDRDWDGPIQSAWNIRSYPTVYVVDAKGIIRFKSEWLPGKALDEAVDALLAEMAQESKPKAAKPSR